MRFPTRHLELAVAACNDRQIRVSGKTEQIAAATQVSTVLSGMLRSDTATAYR